MLTLFEYNPATGEIRDKEGNTTFHVGLVGFEPEEDGPPVLELIKQGVTPDEIIKLRNNGLL